MAFFETAERYSDHLRESMDRFLESRLHSFPEWTPNLFRSHLEKIRHMCGSGGKMLRPALTCLFYEGISGQDAQEVSESAFAFELFHNYTLVHDDIYDEDSERRGMPTIHSQFEREFPSAKTPSGQSPIYAGPTKRYGAVQGIISGKLLFTFGLEALLESNLKWQTKERAIRTYLNTSFFDNIGQALDLEYESATETSEEAYFDLAILKTGRLLEASAAFGAILAGASETFIRNVRPYAENVAICFQIKDDLLDLGIWGSKGREIGSDIRQGKKTFPHTCLMRIRPDFQSDALGNPKASPECVGKVISAMMESWAIHESERIGELRLEMALQNCRAFRKDFGNEAYERLVEFTKYVWERKK